MFCQTATRSPLSLKHVSNSRSFRISATVNQILREDPNRVYIGELCNLIGRDRDTIYRWEKTWPTELMPQRGWQNKRYWTPDQIPGVVSWRDGMDRSNLLLADNEDGRRKSRVNSRKPRLKWKHIVKIRQMIASSHSRSQIAEALFMETTYTTFERLDNAIVWMCRYHGLPVPPMHLDRHDLQGAHTMAKHGVSLQAIVNHLFRRTSYDDHVELEGDLVRAFYLRDWEIPGNDPKVAWADKLTPRQKAEIRRFERQLEMIEGLLDK
jgi:hypothetical protein